MTLAILVAISLMWFSVAILFLGKGEAKATGAITGFVGLVVVLGAFLQTALFKDPFTGGLLFAHGLLYCTVSFALLAGLVLFDLVGRLLLPGIVTPGVASFIFSQQVPLRRACSVVRPPAHANNGNTGLMQSGDVCSRDDPTPKYRLTGPVRTRASFHP